MLISLFRFPPAWLRTLRDDQAPLRSWRTRGSLTPSATRKPRAPPTPPTDCPTTLSSLPNFKQQQRATLIRLPTTTVSFYSWDLFPSRPAPKRKLITSQRSVAVQDRSPIGSISSSVRRPISFQLSCFAVHFINYFV